MIRARNSHRADGPKELDAALALRQLLNPIRRSSVAGLSRRLVVAGVWPDGRGFSARFESPLRPGRPVTWARWRDGLEVWAFPDDPALGALPDLMEQGYQLLGHRLGRRATLGSPDGTHVLHLRPPRTAAGTFEAWLAIQQALASGNVAVPQLGARDASIGAQQTEWARGKLSEDGARAGSLAMLGEYLSRVHATTPPSGLTPRGPGLALDATVRQVAMAVHSGTAFTLWLERRLERWQLFGPAQGHARALVHGDLRMEHVAWHPAPMLLDWERAGPGDPEEDLGQMAAHLFWEQGDLGAADFAGFRRCYRAPDRAVNQALFEYYARLSLVRLLAIRSLSEPEQTRLRAGQERWSRWPEVVADW